jgi:hypothetical protein
VAIVLTAALGIGVNIAVFSVVDAVLLPGCCLRPPQSALPFGRAIRIDPLSHLHDA